MPPPPPPMMPNEGYSVPPGKPPSLIMTCMNIITTFTHLFLGMVAFSAILFMNIFEGSSSLKQHVYLCVIGYVILMSQAVLSLNPHSGWSNGFQYHEKKMIHWVMQVIGSILAIAGCSVRIANVQNNFQTAHGILGLIALIFTIISLIGGLVNLYSSKIPMNLNVIKLLHSCVGCITLITAFLALIFGFDNLYRNVLGDVNADLSIALTVFALVGILISPCMKFYIRLTQ